MSRRKRIPCVDCGEAEEEKRTSEYCGSGGSLDPFCWGRSAGHATKEILPSGFTAPKEERLRRRTRTIQSRTRARSIKKYDALAKQRSRQRAKNRAKRKRIMTRKRGVRVGNIKLW